MLFSIYHTTTLFKRLLFWIYHKTTLFKEYYFHFFIRLLFSKEYYFELIRRLLFKKTTLFDFIENYSFQKSTPEKSTIFAKKSTPQNSTPYPWPPQSVFCISIPPLFVFHPKIWIIFWIHTETFGKKKRSFLPELLVVHQPNTTVASAHCYSTL